jgi:hypothetical protein
MTQTLTAAAMVAAHGSSTSRWGLPIEVETRNRITIAIAAYAYEIVDTPIMGDRTFDIIAQSIQPRVGTCHPLVDEFFATQFSPMTGMWIHHHPELPKIKQLYERYYSGVIREHFEGLRKRGKTLP